MPSVFVTVTIFSFLFYFLWENVQGNESWGYGSLLSLWPQTCQSGHNQSPIPLSIQAKDTKHMKIDLHDYTKIWDDFEIFNAGHTVQVTPPKGLPRLSFKSEFMRNAYVLQHFHFHWGLYSGKGSEHVIDNIRYTMQMHLVHYNNKYKDFSEAVASNSKDALSVVAVFFQEHGVTDNPDIDPIVKNLHHIMNVGTKVFAKGLHIDKLIPLEGMVANYEGSLTTPDCLEIVEWLVLSTPIPVSTAQIQKFRDLKGHDGQPLLSTFRPLQKLNERQVKLYSYEMLYNGGKRLTRRSFRHAFRSDFIGEGLALK